MLKLNKSQFSGNLTRDPELRYTGNGSAVLSLGVAIDNSYKKQDGDWQEKTCFIDVTVFGKFAESLNSRVKKGNHVYVEGSLDQDTWTDENTGQNRSKIFIKAQTVQLTQKKEQFSQSSSQPQYQARPTNPAPATQTPTHTTGIDDEDIPF